MADLAVSEEEIDEQINAAVENMDSVGSKWPGMSYEQGVRDALEWVTGSSDDPPIEIEDAD
jgi:hypothetical protein